MIISGAKLVNTGYVVDVQPIIATNLVANYDPATGISGSTFTDSSGNGYNATLYNSPTTTTINGYNVLQLNGTNQYYYYTSGYSSALLGGSATMDIWFNTSQNSGQQGLISEYGQAGLTGGWQDAILGLSATKMAGGFYNGSTGGFIQSTANYSINTWYNLVVACNASTYYLYVNGVLQNTLSTTRQGTPSPLYYAIGYPDGFGGYLGGAGNGYFAGYIGPVKLYSTALTQAQVTQNFNALRGRYGV